jgi:type IV pilus assembly protein PilQ
VRATLALLGLALLLHPMPARCQAGAEGGLVTLDADSTSVNGILQILAQRSGLNIVTGPELQGRRISIHLKNTPFEDALNLVVRAAGLGYERVGNSILVASTERLATQTGLVTRAFDLRYAKAPDVRDQLQYLCKDVAASLAGNGLVVHASPSTMEQVAGIVEQLDRKPPQVLLQARVVEVNTSALQEIGIDWEKITRWGTVLSEGAIEKSPPGQLPENLGYTPLDQEAPMWSRQKAASRSPSTR